MSENSILSVIQTVMMESRKSLFESLFSAKNLVWVCVLKSKLIVSNSGKQIIAISFFFLDYSNMLLLKSGNLKTDFINFSSYLLTSASSNYTDPQLFPLYWRDCFLTIPLI